MWFPGYLVFCQYQLQHGFQDTHRQSTTATTTLPRFQVTLTILQIAIDPSSFVFVFSYITNHSVKHLSFRSSCVVCQVVKLYVQCVSMENGIGASTGATGRLTDAAVGLNGIVVVVVVVVAALARHTQYARRDAPSCSAASPWST